MIDFDDMFSGADDEPKNKHVKQVLGLVVAAKAKDGESLHAEERAFLETSRLPNCIFLEEDEDGVEIFANAREFADAMGLMVLPTQEQALAWINEREAAAYERHRIEIDEANS